jgi:predicted CxxxxCH...CXXCH cytochrome family protein
MSAFRIALVTLLATALAACGTSRRSDAGGSCTGCHGGQDNQSGAPPTDLAGGTSTGLVTVGAHSGHVAAGVACAACHLVPASTDAPGHIDPSPAEVVLSGLAVAPGGPGPTWNRGAATCSNVYCHGAAFQAASRGASLEPVWTGALAGGACGGCHAATPAGHGPFSVTDCATCHATSVDAAGAIAPGGTHLDGAVQFALDASTCTACHGDPGRVVTVELNRAAPPPPAGGSHRDHLEGADAFFWNGGTCAECHPTPIGSSHDYQVQVAFNGPLGSAGTTPSWDGASCSSVYCHGATLPGARNPSPTWGTTISCGDCHFAGSPPAPHTPTDATGQPLTRITQCYQCHATTVAPTGTILKDGGKHVNGVIDLALP